jgi:hypothetical protein
VRAIYPETQNSTSHFAGRKTPRHKLIFCGPLAIHSPSQCRCLSSGNKLLFLAVFEKASQRRAVEKLAQLGAKEGMLPDGGDSTSMALGEQARGVPPGVQTEWRPVATLVFGPDLWRPTDGRCHSVAALCARHCRSRSLPERQQMINVQYFQRSGDADVPDIQVVAVPKVVTIS